MRHNVLSKDGHEELMHIGNDLTQVTHAPQVGRGATDLTQDLSFGTAIDGNGKPVVMHNPVETIPSFGAHEQRSPIEGKASRNILFNLLCLPFEQHQFLLQMLINAPLLYLKVMIRRINIEHQRVNKSAKDLY